MNGADNKPWMKWHVNRWRNSARVLSMSLAAQGAYHNLLDAAWLQGGRLPNNRAVLYRYALAQTPAEFESVADVVLAMFTISEDGQYLANETLAGEWDESSKRMEEISTKRREAAQKRWIQTSRPEQPGCKSNASALQTAATLENLAEPNKNLQNMQTDAEEKRGEERRGEEINTNPSPAKAGGMPSLVDRYGITGAEKLEDLKAVFEYWLQRTGRNPNLNDLDDTKRKKGLARYETCLKKADPGQGPADLRANIRLLMNTAIDELAASDFHMGREPGKPKTYNTWDIVFRSDDKFMEWLNRADQRRRSA